MKKKNKIGFKNLFFKALLCGGVFVLGSVVVMATVGTFPKSLPTNKSTGDSLTAADWNDVADAVNVYTGDISVDSGKIGIGTTSPSTKLHVTDETILSAYSGETDYGLIVRHTNAASTTNRAKIALVGNGYGDGADNDRGGVISSVGYNHPANGGALAFATLSGGTETELMRLQNGSIGIGTTSPDSSLKLDVEGKIGATEYCDQNGGNCTAAADIGSGGGSGMPSGAILMFDTDCPSGWTRFSDLDDRFPRGNSAYGGTGGSTSHSHSLGSQADGLVMNSGGNKSPSTNSTSNWPPYLNVVWCKAP